MQQRIAAKFGFSVDTNLSRWLCALLLVLSCLAGCAKQELSFEEQVRLRIRELEACVQRSELAELKEAVSLHYRDARGQDKEAMDGLLTYWFLKNQRSYVLTRMVSVTEQEDGRMHTDFFAVLAGSPVAGLTDLSQVQGDIFRFEIFWSLEDEAWNVVEADWHYATKEDLRAFWDGGEAEE